MNFFQVVRLLLRNWLIIGAAAVLVGVGALVVSKSLKPTYTSTAVLFVGLVSGGSTTELAQGSNFVLGQMASYGQLTTTPIVLGPVINDLRLDTTPKELARAVSATTPRNTVIIQVAATSDSPDGAAALANAIGKRLGDAVDSVGPKRANGQPAVAVDFVQNAIPPAFQSFPNNRRNAAIGALVGLLLAAGFVLLRYRTDSSIRSPEALAVVTTLPMLAAVRRAPVLQSRRPAVVQEPASAAAEDVRRVRAGVERLGSGRGSIALVFTSTTRQEGRSTLVINVAAALAEAGHRVVVVDTDFRAPTLEAITGTDGSVGLGSVARASDLGVDAVVQGANRGGFDVVTAGGRDANPTALLSSPATAHALQDLRSSYDFVLVDAPPISASTDALLLREQVDGAIFVVRARRLPRYDVDQALRATATGGLPVLGVVLNQVAPDELRWSAGGSSSPQWTAENAGDAPKR